MPKLFITLILISGAVLVGAFYLRPQWQEFKLLRQETENLRNLSSELDELMQNRDALIQTLNSVSREDLRRIDLALPQGARSAEMLALLEVLAQKNNVLLRQVDLVEESAAGKGGQPRPGGISTPAPSGPYQELPVTLSVLSPYEAFKSFLDDLENNLRIIDVTGLSFTASGRNQFDFTIKAKTYYQ